MTPLDTPKTPPSAVDEINSLMGVLCHFQTDQEFTQNYASNSEAEVLADLSTVCLNFAANTANAAGLGSVNSITAYGKSTKFTLFGLIAHKADPPGPRIFGIKLANNTDEKSLISEINQLI